MIQTTISVWFVCRLCRGSFGEVDAFIEHKKQNHFTQFQNTTSIVFEESERSLPCPVVTNEDHELADESNEPRIKIEVDDEDSSNSLCSEFIDEPNLDLVEANNSELFTYESEINSDSETDFPGLKQPEQNPYVLLKRLTSDEIQSACVPQHNLRHLTFEKPTENQSFSAVTNISTEDDLQLECKLCSKQLQSDAQLIIHVRICAPHHKDRKRYCVTCNRKFYHASNLKNHRLRFHGAEDEKLSLFKFKCHVCSKQYRRAIDLRYHKKSHENGKQKFNTSNSKHFKCLKSNCGKEFASKSQLKRHIASHFDVKPFSCSFRNCKKQFKQKCHLNIHWRIHTGERPYKCTVNNCNEAFITSNKRTVHYRSVHPSLLNE